MGSSLALRPSASVLALKSTRSWLRKTDRERDEQTGWIQKEVGGRRGDSCILPWLTWSQTEDLAAGSQLCAYVKGVGSHRLGYEGVLLTLMPLFPVVSETEAVPPCHCRLGGSSARPRTAFSRREEAELCSRDGRRPIPSVPKG